MDGWVSELVDRGVDRPYAMQLVDAHEPERIEAAVAYFDSLRDVGPGVLVMAIREGRTLRAQPSRVLDAQEAYGQGIVAWLREHFSQWNREEGSRTHSAAIACVIRLHHSHGKRISAKEHGPAIRVAVAGWEAEYGSPGGKG